MYHHRLILGYKGTNYYGWQSLNNEAQKPTIEGVIKHTLQKICNHQHCTISTASRTDAGVHAFGQVVKVAIPLMISSDKLLMGMNSLLPDDIRILKCDACPAGFNPNQDSTWKEYHYYFCTDTVHSPVLNDTVAHIPSDDNDSTNPSLDIELMQEACRLFVGRHDFYNFSKRDTKTNSTHRTIHVCELFRAPSTVFSSHVYYLKISGDGFLRYMIRYIAGALFGIARGQLEMSDISEALINHDKNKISPKAKSRGLHLIEIGY